MSSCGRFTCASDYSSSVHALMKYSVEGQDESVLSVDDVTHMNQSVVTFMQQKAKWTVEQVAQVTYTKKDRFIQVKIVILLFLCDCLLF